MEKRKKDRIPYHAYSIIKLADRTVECPIENLSLEGMLVNSKEIFAPGLEAETTIILEGDATRLSITLTGKALRTENGRTAFSFTDITTDAFIHLRNIIGSMTYDEKKIAKEFEEVDINTTITD